MREEIDRTRKDGHPALYEPPTTIRGVLTGRGLSTAVATIVERDIRKIIAAEQADNDPEDDLERRLVVVEEALAVARSQVVWGPMGPSVSPIRAITRIDDLERDNTYLMDQVEEIKKQISEINQHIIWKGRRDGEDV